MPSHTPAPPPATPERLLVVSVGPRAEFHDVVETALAAAQRPAPGSGLPPATHEADEDRQPDAWTETVRRARRFLDRALVEQVEQVRADSLAEVAALLGKAAAAEPGPHCRKDTLALLLVDAAPTGASGGDGADSVAEALAELRTELPEAVTADLSAYTVHVYEEPDPAVRLARPYTSRQLPTEPWLLAADVVRALTDFVQIRHSAASMRSTARAPRLMGQALHAFLSERAGSSWGLHYYTGSRVSGLISELERSAEAAGNPVLRGPSEHALACGALARWQLDRTPFLIVVTNGMIDEFKGTLANLRESRARGFIVCADSEPDAWFPFQGTVHVAEDSREVLRARRIRHHFLDDTARLDQDLAEAFASYEADEGPVVLLATAAALDFPAPAPASALAPASSATTAPGTGVRPRLQVDESQLTPVLRMLEREPIRFLWQCGQLDAEERELTYRIARLTGVALTDSLTRPGSVARYHDGRRVEEYLGTFGMYGTSARVHDYLHLDGRLRSKRDQSLLFLKSRIAEAATPFAPRALERSLHIVQVTDEPAHAAPFADHLVLGDARDFLREIADRVRPEPEVLALRRTALAATADSPSDLLHQLPLRPMSVNYFFHRLGELLDDLIVRQGYRYTGLFDVGRGGISAVRNLPRTGPGFSGWYGRALMGDALQAVPAVALTREENVLAFVGDGAASLVPDILPTLVQESVQYGRRPAGNLSIFRLVDGGHSIIRTYRETQSGATADRQTQVLHLLDPEWQRSHGPLTLTHRHLDDVQPEPLRDQLLQPGAVNLYSVLLAHNNEGDGMSPAAAFGWQRDTLPEAAFTIARRTRPHT
ncbi:hypothetical protein GXW83_04685 [Streptacidiphilus sp. PB12-B1b]|uniref:hypothetical protein n=1 Tax=Streptacidiphilus sp. PB12-B1b TaxID=2705012 RepID=UPI0015FD81EA|nr:hypothetical protein [Streptacidiphilus sp. PB12-B1b]QMU75161.1 hypothetical protein GXW83_04685 [Streptacidiphilus sp. PB12-B1b]